MPWLITDYEHYFILADESNWDRVHSDAIALYAVAIDACAPGTWETTYPSLALNAKLSRPFTTLKGRPASISSSLSVMLAVGESDIPF
jgi:hypothetical protein